MQLERHRARRYSLDASIELTDLQSEAQFREQTSDLNHETLQATKRYAHLADAHLQQVVERLAGVTPSVTVPDKPTLCVPAAIQ